MSSFKFADEANGAAYVSVDASFITEYLPYAPDVCVKVYLYGLYLCNRPNGAENDLDAAAAALAMTTADLVNAFGYWQELNLVRIVKKDPPEVRYLPAREGMSVLKHIKPGKYAEFNVRLQDMTSRMISAREYNEFYNTMETTGFTPDAMLLTARYCYALKGDGLNYPYILTVARNWAAEGVKTADDAEKRLAEYASADADMSEIFKALKVKRAPDFEDRRAYFKWTRKLGFSRDAVIFCAKSLKGRGGMERLDEKLNGFYEKRLTTAADMEKYLTERDELTDAARKIVKTLGLFYEDIEYVADVYVLEWRKKGYEFGALYFIADFLFKKDVRRLSRMNALINELSEKGLTDAAAVGEYLNRAFPVRAPRAGKGEKEAAFTGRQYSEGELQKLYDDPENFKM